MNSDYFWENYLFKIQARLHEPLHIAVNFIFKHLATLSAVFDMCKQEHTDLVSTETHIHTHPHGSLYCMSRMVSLETTQAFCEEWFVHGFVHINTDGFMLPWIFCSWVQRVHMSSKYYPRIFFSHLFWIKNGLFC